MNHDLVKNLPFALSLAKENRASRKDLVLHSMRQAFFYARQCCRRAIPDDEIFSICYATLTAAAGNFEASPGGLRFFAYSKAYIRGGLHRSWKGKDLVPHTPRNNLIGLEDMDETDEQTVFVEPDTKTIHAKELRGILQELLKSPKLTHRHRMAIQMRFFEERTLEEIGDHFKVSREYARVLIAETLEVLHNVATRKNLKI